MTDPEHVHAWLEHFAACVRNRDIESGRSLFAQDASGFGTRIRQAHTLEELVEQQWHPTWFNTRDFRLVPESTSTLVSEDGSQVVLTALWDSLGVASNGDTFPRQGRCTLVLQRCDSNARGYIARHSHFSKDPVGDL